MNSEINQQNTIQIDLVALLKKMLIQWRCILIFAIIFGLMISGLKYIKDQSAYKAAIVLSKDGTSGDDIIKKSGLTVDEQDAVQMAVSQKKQIEAQSDYLSESLYMNLDPRNIKQLSILYFIKAENGSDAADLLTVYSEKLLSNDSMKKIKKASGLSNKLQYIRELIYVSDAKYSDRGTFTKDSSTDVMKVTFYLPDGVNGSSVEKVINDIVSSYDISDLDVAYGSISKISSDTKIVTNRDIQTTQSTYTNNLNNLKSTYKTSISGFSENQKTLFKKLLSENGLYDVNTSNRLKESSEDQKVELNSTNNSVSIPKVPSFSKKYFAIGFILAIMLYFFFMVIFEILRSRCSNIVVCMESSRLGVLLGTAYNKTNFLFCDKFLLKLFYRKQANLINGIDRILTKAQMNSSHEKLSEAEMWCVGFEAGSVPLIKSIENNASEKEIKITSISTCDGKPDDMISDIVPEKSIIIVACDGVSRKKDIAFIREMLLMRKADYLGLVEIIK